MIKKNLWIYCLLNDFPKRQQPCPIHVFWLNHSAASPIVERSPAIATFCNFLHTSTFRERFSAPKFTQSPDGSIIFSRSGFGHNRIHCTGDGHSGLRRGMHRRHHKRLARKLHYAHEHGLFANCKHLLLTVSRAEGFLFLGRRNLFPDHWANSLKVYPAYIFP